MLILEFWQSNAEFQMLRRHESWSNHPQVSNAYRRHDLTSMSKSPTFTILMNPSSKHVLAKFPEFLKCMLAIYLTFRFVFFKEERCNTIFHDDLFVANSWFDSSTIGIVELHQNQWSKSQSHGVESTHDSWQSWGWKTLVYKEFSSLQWQSIVCWDNFHQSDFETLFPNCNFVNNDLDGKNNIVKWQLTVLHLKRVLCVLSPLFFWRSLQKVSNFDIIKTFYF